LTINHPICLALREQERRFLAAANGTVGLTPLVIRAIEETDGLRSPHVVLPSGTDRLTAQERSTNPAWPPRPSRAVGPFSWPLSRPS
jgi:hypothetical protein